MIWDKKKSCNNINSMSPLHTQFSLKSCSAPFMLRKKKKEGKN